MILIKAGPLGKRPKGTGHASGQARPWRTGGSTGENQRPGVGPPLALPPRGEHGRPRAPTEVCEAGAGSVVLAPRSGQDPSPWLRAAASVFAVLALPGWQGPQPRPSGTLLAGRPRLASRSSQEVKATPNTAPARTEPWGRLLLQLQLRSLPTRGCQYSDHSTALLPLSTVTTWEPAGDQATALMDELQRERWGHG